MSQTTPNYRFLKFIFGLQNFLLRHNLMGRAGDYLMVVTTTGRKTGKKHSTPIGYLRDGDAIIAINPHGRSNWYKNLLVNPAVTLTVKGEDLSTQAEEVTLQGAIDRLFELYRQQQPKNFPRLFGVAADAPPDELDKARDSRRFIRFTIN